MKTKLRKQSFKVISNAAAQAQTLKWQSGHTIKAFLFHAEELSAVINEIEGVKARFYIGLNGAQIEMLIVGVDADGKDIISTTGQNSKVYNFALPCPSTCDQTSSLYHGPGSGNTTPAYVPSTWNQEIPFQTAFNWTLAWQQQHEVKSFLFDLTQLQGAMAGSNTERVRVYFGEDVSNTVTAIMVGVDNAGFDVVNDLVEINELSACGIQTGISSCDSSSPLYHNIPAL